MILISNICIIIIVVYCLLHISAYVVANFVTIADDRAITIGRRENNRKATTRTEVIIIIVLFLILSGAVMPRLCAWLF